MKLIELNRKMNIYTWVVGLIIILIISGVFLTVYLNRDEVYFVHYDDKSDLDYQVALKENDYYDKVYIDKNNQYIASLIDFINGYFNYELSIKEDFEYNYKYKIVANVNVIDDETHKSIYTFSENILEEVSGKTKHNLEIQEKVKIDYNKYNDLISEFIKVYNLNKVTSKLSVNMYVGVAGTEEDFQKEEDSVISLDIPLTTNTVAIDVNYDISNNVDSLITLKSSYKNSKIWLGLSIIIFALDIVLLIALIKYIKDSETEEEKYNSQLSKILNNYGTYISRVEDEFDMSGYQILRVKNFVDLLEVRDTMHIPIIMVENKGNLMAYFVIPTNNNILYFYSLGVTQYALPTTETKEMEKVEV